MHLRCDVLGIITWGFAGFSIRNADIGIWIGFAWNSFFNSDFKVYIPKLSQGEERGHSDVLHYNAMTMGCQ